MKGPRAARIFTAGARQLWPEKLGRSIQPGRRGTALYGEGTGGVRVLGKAHGKAKS